MRAWIVLLLVGVGTGIWPATRSWCPGFLAAVLLEALVVSWRWRSLRRTENSVNIPLVGGLFLRLIFLFAAFVVATAGALPVLPLFGGLMIGWLLAMGLGLRLFHSGQR